MDSLDASQRTFCNSVLRKSCHRLLEVAGCTALSCIAVLWYFTHQGVSITQNPLFYIPVWQGVAFFAMIYATAISAAHIRAHIMCCNAKLSLQANAVRILLVVPVYAIAAFTACMVQNSSHHWAEVISSLREAYESLVLASFVQWVVEFWGGTAQLAAKMSNEEVRHFFFARPFLRKRAPGSDFVAFVLIGILQYAFVMLLVLLLQIAIWFWNSWVPPVVHEDTWKVIHGTLDKILSPMMGPEQVGQLTELFCDFNLRLIPKTLKLVSNGFAMYCLLLWYERLLGNRLTSDGMTSIKGIHKFLCIKFIILLTLWQEMAAKLAVKNGYISSHFRGPYTFWEAEFVADGLLNILICLEMLLFAEWHCFAYAYSEPLPADDAENEDGGVRSGSCVGRFCGLLCKSHIHSMLIGVKTLRAAAKRHRVAVLTVREMMRIEQRAGSFELNDQKIAELEAAMMEFDHRSGEVSIAQLEFLLVEGGLSTREEVLLFLREADLDQSGGLTAAEFVACVKKLYRRRHALPSSTGKLTELVSFRSSRASQ